MASKVMAGLVPAAGPVGTVPGGGVGGAGISRLATTVLER